MHTGSDSLLWLCSTALFHHFSKISFGHTQYLLQPVPLPPTNSGSLCLYLKPPWRIFHLQCSFSSSGWVLHGDTHTATHTMLFISSPLTPHRYYCPPGSAILLLCEDRLTVKSAHDMLQEKLGRIHAERTFWSSTKLLIHSCVNSRLQLPFVSPGSSQP